MSTEEKIQALIDTFYSPKTASEVNDMKWEIFYNNDLKDMESAYQKYRVFIDGLKHKYKDLVLARTVLANEAGYDNFYLYMANWDGVPQNMLKKLRQKQYKTNRMIVDNFPVEIMEKDRNFFTKFNTLNFEEYIGSNYELPHDVINVLVNIEPGINLEHIQFRTDNESLFHTEIEHDQIIVYYNKNSNGISAALNLVHEIGHALFLKRLKEKRIMVDNYSSYQLELPAITLEVKYLSTLDGYSKKIIMANYLLTNILNHFEYRIYTDFDIDLDEAYGASYSQAFEGKHFGRNPFYVLEPHLIFMPCYTTVYSALYCQML